MLDPRHLVYDTTCVHSTGCLYACYIHVCTDASRRCTYLPRHEPDAPFAEYSPTLSARDVLGRASFLPLPLYEHDRYRFKGVVHPLWATTNQRAPWQSMTITITQPSVRRFSFFFLSFDVACPCRRPRLAQSWPSEIVFLSRYSSSYNNTSCMTLTL